MSGFEILIGILLCLYIFYHWNRRHMYRLSNKVKTSEEGWPILGFLPELIGDAEKLFNSVYRVSKKSGDIGKVWVGNQLVYLLGKPEYVEKLLINNKYVGKPVFFYNFLKPLFGDGLVTGPVHTWKKNRKLIAPTFHPKILETFIDIFNEKAESLINTLQNEIGKTIDIFHFIAPYTSLISIESTMGVQISEDDMKKSNEMTKFVKEIDNGLSIGVRRVFYLLYKFDFTFKFFSLGKAFFDACKFCNEFTSRVVKERRRIYEEEQFNNVCYTEKERNIFIDQLIQLKQAGTKINDKDLEDESKTLILAATDTTAAAVSFFLLLTGMHPEIQEKVYEEIVEVVGLDRSVTPTDLINLKYMDMVLKETLRLCSPIPYILRDIHEDLSLGDITLPKGSTAAIPILNIHHQPNLWPDPYKFDPNRFQTEEIAKRHPLCWLPFSAGPRNCIGQKYAMMVAKTIITHLLRKYKFSTPIKSVEDMKFKFNITLKPIDGVLVNFVARH